MLEVKQISEGIVRTGISDRIINGLVSKLDSMSLGSKFMNQCLLEYLFGFYLDGHFDV